MASLLPPSPATSQTGRHGYFGALILLRTCLVPNCGCPEQVNYFLFIWTFLAHKAVAGTWLDPQLFVIH